MSLCAELYDETVRLETALTQAKMHNEKIRAAIVKEPERDLVINLTK
jgi:hypothetical protein